MPNNSSADTDKQWNFFKLDVDDLLLPVLGNSETASDKLGKVLSGIPMITCRKQLSHPAGNEGLWL